METKPFNTEKYKLARKRVNQLKKFYKHLLSFVVVMLFLVFINLRFSPAHIWFYWPMIGWGIGLFFHAISVFNFLPFFGKSWEERKINQIMNKESNAQQWK